MNVDCPAAAPLGLQNSLLELLLELPRPGLMVLDSHHRVLAANAGASALTAFR